MVMIVSLRTGEMFHSSTAGLAIMTTTALSQDHPPPQVASQFEKLFRQRHRLVEIGQKIAERVICHGIPLFDYSKLEIERVRSKLLPMPVLGIGIAHSVRRRGASICTRCHSTIAGTAEVIDETSGKTIPFFRCTQLILYPR